MYISDIDDLRLDKEEDGIEVVRELGKSILVHGQWTIILVAYKEFEKAKKELGDIKYALFKLRRIGDGYKVESRFNLGGIEIIKKLLESLKKWGHLEQD